MAEGYYKKPLKVLQMQFALLQEVTVLTTGAVSLLDRFNLHNVATVTVGQLPEPTEVLVGVFPIWCNSITAAGIVLDTILWSPTEISISASASKYDVNVQSIRLLTFWE